MPAFSFDVVSDYDKQEINNVYEQARRELTGRYDFKDTAASIDWLDGDRTGLKLTAENEYQLDAMLEIVRKKLAGRGQPQKLLDASRTPVTANMTTSLEVPFKHGLDQDKAKRITSLIRSNYPKAKTQIQGDAVRVTSASKDELQAIQALLNQQDFDFPLDFTNYR
jgi:uncharacterized protein YajQ (UPF0234 family)